ncbi:hypothetical protein AVEN_139296-1 [Araneus ventricosus]|uniref:Uncharacterized protein n=1 Tax=Araneus ventricosus TaxID=182803 RepID=A0A4Y2R9F8_ARAVE|nr:hypothetical protein AVEN_47324-1 [Araneus ventricosus]GBN72792.1 hypothetical protein AVEN_72769-1 [Araneus ventricosus]GBN72799.1 hypothetical protein AVEN_139296-1 [Araneus ventricosus]
MMDVINMYEAEMMEPQSKPSDPQGDPMCHNFLVVPWLDPEYYVQCDFAEDLQSIAFGCLGSIAFGCGGSSLLVPGYAHVMLVKCAASI